jgi:hypothetical protein
MASKKVESGEKEEEKEEKKKKKKKKRREGNKVTFYMVGLRATKGFR